MTCPLNDDGDIKRIEEEHKGQKEGGNNNIIGNLKDQKQLEQSCEEGSEYDYAISYIEVQFEDEDEDDSEYESSCSSSDIYSSDYSSDSDDYESVTGYFCYSSSDTDDVLSYDDDEFEIDYIDSDTDTD